MTSPAWPRMPAAARARRGAWPSTETTILVLVGLLAGLRVFLFAAGFPLFNNVDEPRHFDLVHKYARGHVPAGMEPPDPAAVRDLTLWGSPEYLQTAAQFPGGRMPPPVWRLPREAIQPGLEARVRQAATATNPESTQMPLYYVVAGLWYRLGRLAGLDGGQAAYWIRFLDVVVIVLLVALARGFARALFPGSRFLGLGMPLLVGFLPQDALYSINNDVLVPLAGGAALLGLFVIVRDRRPPGAAWYVATGLLVAAGVLVKISALPVLAVAVVAVATAAVRAEAALRRTAIARGTLLLLAAALPLLAWAWRDARVLGDWTGTAAKTAMLGWTPMSPSAVLVHPIFTPGGLATFWSGTMASFWRGEFTWGLERIASAGWDRFYAVSSFVLPAAVVLALVFRRRSVAGEERAGLWLSLVTFLAAIGFLAGSSVAFDFGACFYPSREHPFLTSGRLALAALLPFAALYLKGIEVLLPWRGAAAVRWVLLLALVGLMTLAELRLSREALGSAYNWFHLLPGGGAGS